MKPVTTVQDFDAVATNIGRIIDSSKTIPENVFRKAFRYFLFTTFDDLHMSLFFDHVSQFMKETGEKNFWVTTLDPDPRSYFAANFGFYGTFEFSVSDTGDDYISALFDIPESSPADALMHNGNLLLVFSTTGKWAVYGSRNADIAVCAFTEHSQMELFKSIYGSDLLDSVRSAAEYAYKFASDSTLIDDFCENYASD